MRLRLGDKFVVLISIILMFSGIFSVAVAASSDTRLVFSPQRVVLENGERSATLRLRNGGRKAGTFRISLSDVIYQDDGSVEHVDTPPEGFPSARSFIRFSPRQVRLNPGETQLVRVLAIRQPKDTDAEYRVHAVMQQLPDALSLEQQLEDKVMRGGVSFSQATAIPVIIRVGKPEAKTSIGFAKKTKNGVDLVINRTGSRSIYSTIEVYENKVAEDNRIGLIKGFAVPVPNVQRKVSVKVEHPSNKPYVIIVRDQKTNAILAKKTI